MQCKYKIDKLMLKSNGLVRQQNIAALLSESGLDQKHCVSHGDPQKGNLYLDGLKKKKAVPNRPILSCNQDRKKM